MSRSKLKTEHAGPKGSDRKSGFWGRRVEAKLTCKKVRRGIDRQLEHEAKTAPADPTL